jgi:GDP-L-fucose synthase
MLKKVLILGANGFLGSNLSNFLNSQKYIVLNHLGKHHVDLRFKDQCEKFILQTNPDVVVNCAANVGGILYSQGKEAEIFDDNLEIGTNVVQSVSKLTNAYLINPISNCVYPGSLEIYKESDLWGGEVHESVKSYGMVKRFYVEYSDLYSRKYEFNNCNLIFPNIYGPGDHLDEVRAHALGALIYKVQNAIKNNSMTVTVWGSGKPVREWIFVKDVANIIERAIELQIQSKAINCGSGESIAIKDLAELISDLSNYSGKIEFDYNKPDGALIKKMETKKFYQCFGEIYNVELRHGIAETIEWYKKEMRI